MHADIGIPQQSPVPVQIEQPEIRAISITRIVRRVLQADIVVVDGVLRGIRGKCSAAWRSSVLAAGRAEVVEIFLLFDQRH